MVEISTILTNFPIYFIAFFVYLGIAWLYVQLGKYALDYFFLPAFSIMFIRKYLYVKRNKEYEAEKDKHIAVILANDYLPERMMVYRENIPKLLKYFKKQDWPYKVYAKVDKEKISAIINDESATILYLIGHGQKHGIKINRKEAVYYCEFQDAPTKKFIAQLHCNHLGGKSLADYILDNPINSFVTDKKLNSIGLNNLIDEVVKGKIHGSP